MIWVGTDDGRLHVTRDGGKTWTSLEKNVPGVPANTWIPNILPSQATTPPRPSWSSTTTGAADFTPYVYRTDDWGKTWKSLATRGPPRLRPGDRAGPGRTRTSSSWAPSSASGSPSTAAGAGCSWTHGLPTTSVMALAIHPRDHDLVIATHGRGLYVLDDIRPLRPLAGALAEPLHLYPRSPTPSSTASPRPGGFAAGAGEFQGENRALRRPPHLLAERPRPAAARRGEGARAQGRGAGGAAQGRAGEAGDRYRHHPEGRDQRGPGPGGPAGGHRGPGGRGRRRGRPGRSDPHHRRLGQGGPPLDRPRPGRG